MCQLHLIAPSLSFPTLPSRWSRPGCGGVVIRLQSCGWVVVGEGSRDPLSFCHERLFESLLDGIREATNQRIAPSAFSLQNMDFAPIYGIIIFAHLS